MKTEDESQAYELIKLASEALDKAVQLLSPAVPIAESEELLLQPPLPALTRFTFGAKSRKELEGVDPRLVECATIALKYFTTVDFRVFDGLRTVEEQREYVRRGTSKTMNSKHLEGKALDLVPIIGGVLKWDWDGCAAIAFAMDQAATYMGIADKIVWGGAWDRTLAEYGGTAEAYLEQVAAYRHRKLGPDFVDGPHFEIRN